LFIGHGVGIAHRARLPHAFEIIQIKAEKMVARAAKGAPKVSPDPVKQDS
jgi:hypothetical protein